VKVGRKGAVILVMVLLGSMLLCLCLGKYSVSAWECLQILFSKVFQREGNWSSMTENVILRLRLPRVLAAVAVGSSLSLSGAVYQGIFQNPLVSPDFLGVSSGACIGAAAAILLALPSGSIQLFAFIGGITAVALTVSIPRAMRSDSNLMLVLSGIIVGGAMSSVMGLIKYLADPTTELAAITYWQMGSLSYITYDSLFGVLLPIMLCTVILLKMSWWIDILSLGETDARMLGADVRKVRRLAIVCATILTASSVCIAGTIGWIGLVIPHFGRMLAGSDHRRLLPASCLLGAVFLLFVDTVTRTVGPAEIPISILTGALGAPFYAWLLYKQKARLRE
jgi:iron complex transport system permease protein